MLPGYSIRCLSERQVELGGAVKTLCAFILGFVAGSAGVDQHHMETKLMEKVARESFDPASVQFRNVTLTKRRHGYVMCGEIDAKNRYGEYVGFRKFVAEEAESPIIENPDGPKLGVMPGICDQQRHYENLAR